MNITQKTFILAFAVIAGATQADAATINNGGFESGLAGWTIADKTDPVNPAGSGTFLLQTGTQSPVNLLPVPGPPQGNFAAMTDAEGPGTHILYQDIFIPSVLPQAFLSFSLFVNNMASDFFVPDPPHLEFDLPDLNQQARVDLLNPLADPFSVASADILQNLFQTMAGDPLLSGYNAYNVDVTAVLQAQAGQTVRLRFAQVNNVDIFNLGVDNVGITVIPEPSTWLLIPVGLAAAGLLRRRRR
jgi:hypothetical protein